jgi:hypothetical protein
VAATLVAMPACSLFFGGEQRVDNSSHDYTVVHLDHLKGRGWSVLPPPPEPADKKTVSHQHEAGDVAFLHKQSGAIISLDSVCREYRNTSLEELLKTLLLGLNTTSKWRGIETTIDGTPALITTLDAANGSPEAPQTVRVRAAVLKKNGCVYDFMYVAPPDVFDEFASDFERFMKGFHVK